MKTRVNDPLVAAATTGGCSFEPAIGWWTYTTDPAQAKELGHQFEDGRDALYIPTIQKNGVPVDTEVIEKIKARARQLGLNNFACARGMWILSTTGEAQVEVIWIAWATSCELRDLLPALAKEIRSATNQDCVAWEEGGTLKFTGSEQPVGEAA
jgi:hypothetical protein